MAWLSHCSGTEGSARCPLAQSLGRWGSGFLFLRCHSLGPVMNDMDFTLTKFTSELTRLFISFSYCNSHLCHSATTLQAATGENKQVGGLESWERMWLLRIVKSLFDYVRVSEMASMCQQSRSGWLWCHRSAYLIVCPYVQHNRKALLRRHSTTGGVEGQFTHRDAHAIAAQIPQAQNPLSICYHYSLAKNTTKSTKVIKTASKFTNRLHK